MKDLLIHGSSVDIQGEGVLIIGKSGSGKSSLALELIDRGGVLVADDQTKLVSEVKGVILQSPSQIQGKLEVRGVGILSFPYLEFSPLKLCVEVAQDFNPERLPEDESIMYHETVLPLLRLSSRDPLNALKVELKLRQIGQDYAA